MIASSGREPLRHYVPADAREAAFRERMIELLEHPDPFARTAFDPGHFTASAFVLAPERDAVLLIFHKKLRLWLQPGGHIEPEDATIEDAARREVAEEVGLRNLSPLSSGLFDVDIHPIPARADEPEHEHFDLRVLLLSSARELEAGDEVEGARWVPFDDVASITGDESVRRAVRKIRAVLRERASASG